MTTPSERLHKLQTPMVAWIIAIVLGAIHAAGWAFSSNPDGNAYMHLADFISRGDWAHAADACWSPGYPALLGLVFWMFRPSAYWEAPAAHAVNFFCYIVAFAAFRFFLESLRRHQRARAVTDTRRVISFDEPAVSACIHLFFVVVSLDWIGLKYITPDMLVAAAMYAAAGIALRIHHENRAAHWFMLGAVVGIGYLIKAVMFPVGILFLAAASITGTGFNVTAKRAAAAFAGFLIFSAPQIIAVSKIVGKPAYSGVGGMVYAKDVNHYPLFWTGEPPGSGIPKHPVRLIHKDPAVYEYTSTDPGSSYPISDRPTYWSEGMIPHFSLRAQRAVTEPIIVWYCQLMAPLLFVLAVLFLLRSRKTSRDYWFLIVTALGAFGLFALVYAEPRYLAPFALLLFASVAASFSFSRSAVKAVMPLFAVLALFDALHMFDRTRLPLHQATHFGATPNSNFVIASKLKSLGINQGDHVAVVGNAFDGNWARLAKIQIAMEVEDDAKYWSAPDSVRNAVNDAFRKAGAVAIVANENLSAAPSADWIPLGVEGNYLLKLR